MPVSGQVGLGPNMFATPDGVEVFGSTVRLSDSANDRLAGNGIKPRVPALDTLVGEA